MDRRTFFKNTFRRSAEEVVKHIDHKVKQKARHWIRPPYAQDELNFLLNCTRCDACIEACPHDVIFNLSGQFDVQAAGTPALDLLNVGCHLCEDWPCVNACETEALQIAKSEKNTEPDLPRLALATIDTETCLPYSGPECGACEYACPVPGALRWEMTRPVIDQEICIGCGLCREVCIVSPSAVLVSSLNQSETQHSP
ncbi:MAG: 4Fe-4S dicluster domain-containing protein [Gammaproteobacteria bacterium]|nr:4Fe-4S dicluster domain-containing protein [Gammaproteobacteria bacterium]